MLRGVDKVKVKKIIRWKRWSVDKLIASKAYRWSDDRFVANQKTTSDRFNFVLFLISSWTQNSLACHLFIPVSSYLLNDFCADCKKASFYVDSACTDGLYGRILADIHCKRNPTIATEWSIWLKLNQSVSAGVVNLFELPVRVLSTLLVTSSCDSRSFQRVGSRSSLLSPDVHPIAGQ